MWHVWGRREKYMHSLAGEFEGNQPLGETKVYIDWVGGAITMAIQEIGWKGMDWINVTECSV
jgi:hypothetical protein